MSSPGTTGTSGLSSDGEMSYVANARQSLTAEAIGADGRQVFKRFELGSGESLTKDSQVVALPKARD